MKDYELLYIVDASLTDEKREELISKVTALVNDNKGEASEPEKWGVRKYAYPINYKNEGYYVLMNFKGDENLPRVLNGQLLITDGVVRHMIVAK